MRQTVTLGGKRQQGRERAGPPQPCNASSFARLKGARQKRARLQECPHIRKTEVAMNIDRRQLALPVLAIGFLSIVPALAASADEEAVAKNVEAFRAAQVALDAKALDALCAAELSYSHSDARIEDKATFIKNVTTNRNSKTLSLAYQDPKIRVVGDAAIVRFKWVSETEAADGKKGSTNLLILMNWQKQGADWKLLSRAATKL
ncbi:MAG TPA: nuclear transport factor 2 family protein [Pseudolabrys sp.]|nr:nuclear transport factor 2 family protein [Pseudolabrys sp.]